MVCISFFPIDGNFFLKYRYYIHFTVKFNLKLRFSRGAEGNHPHFNLKDNNHSSAREYDLWGVHTLVYPFFDGSGVKIHYPLSYIYERELKTGLALMRNRSEVRAIMEPSYSKSTFWKGTSRTVLKPFPQGLFRSWYRRGGPTLKHH